MYMYMLYDVIYDYLLWSYVHVCTQDPNGEVMFSTIIFFLFHRARSDNKPYVFAGLANGTLIAFDQCVLQTPDARPDSIIELNDGPVRGIKRLHGLLYIISGLEVFVINLSTLMITRQWEACDE